MSVPFGMIKSAGADGAGCDLSKLRRTEEDALAEAVEAGLGILAGVLPATGEEEARQLALSHTERAGAARPPAARETAERVIELWRRMGWPTVRGGPDPG